MEEWLALVKSKSGERGIFNRVAAQNQAAKYGRRNPNMSFESTRVQKLSYVISNFVTLQKSLSVRVMTLTHSLKSAYCYYLRYIPSFIN